MYNKYYHEFRKSKGQSHKFFAPKTLQQNGIIERKNLTLIKMDRVMLKAVNIACYTITSVIETSMYSKNLL